MLNLETIFDAYDLSSNQPQNVINLEINAQNLHEALRSTLDTPSRQLALVKRQGTPYLCLTIRKISPWKRARQQQAQHQQRHPQPLHGEDPDAAAGDGDGDGDGDGEALLPPRGVPAAAEPPDDNATVIVHEIPVRVLKPERLAALHEPQIPDPDVFIHLPPLPALKAISDRYTRLASTSTSTSTSRPRPGTGAGSAGLDGQRAAKIDLAATMHGKLRLSLEREGVLALKSTWEGLENVRPAAEDLEGGEEALAMHPCTRMLEMGAGAEEERGEAAWARVRVDGRDWGRVLAVGKCGGDVVAGE